MPDIAIKVEHVSKRYEIGENKVYPTFRDKIVGFVKLPYKLLTGTLPQKQKPYQALSNVSFEVKKGEVIGVIGRNGAGKSTLLKILSRITEPTTGKVTMYGKVSSMLEVGTGFNPELTGRENIYLNGAILGMTRKEINKKFEEIVKFSGVENFLDTPVKHYSSGMYVRLAFAVAANLDSDILLIDEVLAVGDAEFQKKCLGKMNDAANSEGRTVLFVSHDISAVVSLCKKTILLDAGKLELYSDTSVVVNKYLNTDKKIGNGLYIRDNFNSKIDLIRSVELLNRDNKNTSSFQYGDDVFVLVKTNTRLKQEFGIELRIKNSKGEIVAYVSSWIHKKNLKFSPGDVVLIKIPEIKLVQDSYVIDFVCRVPNVYHVDNWWDFVNFRVTYCQPGDSPFLVKTDNALGSIVIPEAVFSVSKG